MTDVGASPVETRKAFEQLLGELRPKLHRYCARMTGSVIDGEDVVQEALVKAIEAIPRIGSIANPQGWIFRIAHNAALDFLRRRARQEGLGAEEPDLTSDPINRVENRQIAAASLGTFMRLPVAQRSSVILMDVLGYSLEEIGDVMETSIPAVKAALHRGRTHLRELAAEPDDLPPAVMSEADRARLIAYIDHFNAHDFAAIRDMLAEDARLELVNRTRMQGRREVSTYFGNYGSVADWCFVPGFVERRPAILVRDPRSLSKTPAYFILLEWAGEQVAGIRDFRYARYATESADLAVLD